MNKSISFTAYQVQKSHYPRTFTGLKEGEATSYENARTLVITITTCLCLFSLLEAIFFLLLSTVVNNENFEVYLILEHSIKGSSLEEDNPGGKRRGTKQIR